MRLQNTSEFQALADNKAREDGVFFFADYVGIHEGKLVYQAMHEDSEPRCEGFPILIFIDAEGNVSESIGMDGLEILNGMRHRDYRRGREIFQGYQLFSDRKFSFHQKNRNLMPLDQLASEGVNFDWTKGVNLRRKLQCRAVLSYR